MPQCDNSALHIRKYLNIMQSLAPAWRGIGWTDEQKEPEDEGDDDDENMQCNNANEYEWIIRFH